MKIDSIKKDSICTICQSSIKESIDDGKEVVVLECNDIFCKDCIFKWLAEYQNKCPNCKTHLYSRLVHYIT